MREVGSRIGFLAIYDTNSRTGRSCGIRVVRFLLVRRKRQVVLIVVFTGTG